MFSKSRKKKRKPPARPARPAARPQPQQAAASRESGDQTAKQPRFKLPEGGKGFLTFSLLFLLLLYAAGLFYMRPAAEGRRISFDQVVRYASSNRIKSAEFLDQDSRIIGTALVSRGQPPVQFWTSYPRSDAATNDLLKNLVTSGATVEINLQPFKSVVRFVSQFLLPLMILANLFALLFMMGKSGGSSAASDFMSFGRIGNKRVGAKEKSRATFADVAAAEEALTELKEVRDYLANSKAFEQMGALPPKGVLLTGPPGCGKTLLARAVAGEAKANFYSISGSEFVESLVGVGAARVRDLFRQARSDAPALIFIDELDAVGRQRGAGLGGGHDEREQTLNELLVQIDGFSSSEGVVVIGATNRVDILDPALLRAGRFDRQITVERPDLTGRAAILELHARKRRLANPGADLGFVARITPGFTGADLANLLNEAALLAVRERAHSIERSHLEEAVDRVVAGPRQKSRIISDEEKSRISYHEAGHAIVAAAYGKTDAIQKLSIIARGRGIGHLAVIQEERLMMTRSEMEEQITIAMGGVASEELVLGEPSTGSEQDLERATNTARDMAGRFGMTSKLGRARVLQPQGEIFLGRDYLSTKDVSQPTLEDLDGEVRRILAAQEGRAEAILSGHRDLLDELAVLLTTHETLHGEELHPLLNQVGSYVDFLPAEPSPARRKAGTNNTRKTAVPGQG